MGILTAMSNAVSGISAQSFAMENISGNIANSSTTAYKRRDTSFADLVMTNTNNAARVTSGSVQASSRSTIGLDGDIQSSDVDTHIAINGTGFFSVTSDPTDNAAGTLYTRSGDFELFYNSIDKNTYLRNGSGYTLMGKSYNTTLGQGVGNVIPITIDKSSQSAKVTSDVTYKLNLPTEPVTTYSASNADDATANIYQDTGGRSGVANIVSSGTVLGADEDEFLANSISGGSVTVYDAQGNASNMILRWAKFGEDSATGRSEWGLFYQNSASAGAAADAWTQIPSGSTETGGILGAGTGFYFDSNGQQLDTTSSITMTGVSIEGKTLADFKLDLDATEFADRNGTITTNQLTQDGYATGEFEGISIDDADGTISYNYSNGQTVKKWSIPLVTFNGAAYLKAENGGAYSDTIQSGSPLDYNGSLSSSSLEGSNVDISEEFTKLIVTQQAFSANSKVITTADNMISDVLNIIR